MSELVPTRGVRQTRVFNSRERVVEGWYWLLPSADLRRGEVKPVEVIGKQLAVWRGRDDGVVRVMDAHCPHMGAHLAEGRVEGDTVRCFFHHWKMDGSGEVVDIPCLEKPVAARVGTWPAAEKYGLIWVWTGEEARLPVPYIPEIGEDTPVDAQVAVQFEKGCHPNVVMVNAIDEQHFDSVHNLPVDLHFAIDTVRENCIRFDNTTPLPDRLGWLRRFYKKALTYRMVYWNGSTGSVTVGPDFWHFHVVFALRLTDRGTCEGITLPVTAGRAGITGWLLNRVALLLSRMVAGYFAVGDTKVFETMKWDFATPIKPDRSIIHFIQHLEGQRTVTWGDWKSEEPVPDEAAPEASAWAR